MGDFSDDYGGYDVLGLYEQRDDDRMAQRAKQLTPQRRAWVGLTDKDFVLVNQLCINPVEAAVFVDRLLKKRNT
jgi:uncharacterized protein YecT (DUF1311 family)